MANSQQATVAQQVLSRLTVVVVNFGLGHAPRNTTITEAVETLKAAAGAQRADGRDWDRGILVLTVIYFGEQSAPVDPDTMAAIQRAAQAITDRG